MAGSLAANLEDALPSLVAAQMARQTVRLLQRLDFGTSGIVAGALSEKAERAWRAQEKTGLVHKYYLALLAGKLEKAVTVDLALDTANRRKSRVLDKPGTSATSFMPLAGFSAEELETLLPETSVPREPVTLAVCGIWSGQRHQIRAHAAAIGHPLHGDDLYGDGNGVFVLQHFALSFPGHKILLPQTLSLAGRLPAQIQTRLGSWLEKHL